MRGTPGLRFIGIAEASGGRIIVHETVRLEPIKHGDDRKPGGEVTREWVNDRAEAFVTAVVEGVWKDV